MSSESTLRLQPPGNYQDVKPMAGATRKTAVFVAHGMGQQIPYDTLAQVAEGLMAADGSAAAATPPMARAVKVDTTWLQRAELLLTVGGEQVETHVYEGYWAPLTEGRITVRQVIGFLVDAALNGIRNSEHGEFKRYLFGKGERFHIPIRTMIYLVIALATTLSLVVMNSTIAVVSAGRALLSQTPQWLSDGLFIDLTTVFNVVITTFAVFGAALAFAAFMSRKRWPRQVRVVWSVLTIPLFVISLMAVILGGVAIPVLFYCHVQGGVAPGAVILSAIADRATIEAFNATFDKLMLGAIAIVGGALALWHLVRTIGALAGTTLRTFFVILVFLALVGAAGWLVWKLYCAPDDSMLAIARGGLAWVLLVIASARIRTVLVQFVGDVAIYVAPYKLDAFYALRSQILEKVLDVAKRVYGMRDVGGGALYNRVIVVGHSLGSVIAYDTLNQMVREDGAAGGALDVVGRTPLLMTFGSPLDKTAFIFAGQAVGTSDIRESLTALKQPLIESYAFRPEKWINFYSAWDIISGHLSFYDRPVEPSPPNAKRVENRVDDDATTLLLAHTEYWRRNSRLFSALHAAV